MALTVCARNGPTVHGKAIWGSRAAKRGTLYMGTASVLAIIAGSCAGALVSGISGFAFGLMALCIWAWVLPPSFLAPMVVAGSIVTQLSALAVARHRVEWSRVMPFLTGGILGVPLGVLLLGVMNIRLFKGVVGVLLVAYSSYFLLAAPKRAVCAGGRPADGLAGFIGGFMGGLAGLNGPAPVLWCAVRGWSKDVQRGVLQTFLLTTHCITFVCYAATGKLTTPVLGALAWMLPAVLISALAGAKVSERISERSFKHLVLMLLFLSGVALLVGVFLA